MKSSLVVSLLLLFVVFPAYGEISTLTPEECQAMKRNGIMREDNPVRCERLRRVSFIHMNFEHKKMIGELIVLDAVASSVERIFRALCTQGFQVDQAIPNYKSMPPDNNTIGFYSRPITGDPLRWSLHAYGAAIDVNPLQNPYLAVDETQVVLLPAESLKTHINRLNYRPGKETRAGMAEGIVDIFAYHGFIDWGGYWNHPIDYQHFEIGNHDFVAYLARLQPRRAACCFRRYLHHYRACMSHAPRHGPQHEAVRARCVLDTLNQGSAWAQQGHD